MENNLVEISKTVKKEADLLLEKSALLDFLANYGEVFIRGSYELDLMIDGDIDIYVVNNKLDKNLAIKVLNKLIMKNFFRGYLFYDFVEWRKKGFPNGYYLGAKTKFENKKWNMDIWFMREMDKESDEFMNFVKKNINDQNKEIILKIKKECKNKQLNIPSYLIYLAVIKENVKTYKEFTKSLPI